MGLVPSPNNLSGPDSLLGIEGMGKPKPKPKRKKDEDTTDEQTKVKGYDATSSLAVTRDAKGEWRWLLRSSSGFRDRDGEIITTKALEDDCERLNTSGNFGPLRWWHIGSKSETPEYGLDIGDCDLSMMSGHTRIESGTFRAPWLGHAMATHVKSLGGSLGFKYRGLGADKTIDYLRTFERSLLPKVNASNLMALKNRLLGKSEDSMTEAEQVAKLKELVGADNHALVDSFLASSKRDEATLKDMGVGVKAKADDEAKEDKKEEASETAAAEAKEDMGEMKKKMKEAPAFDTDALATALMSRMSAAFITPAMLDTRFEALTSVATKSADESKVALKAQGDKLDSFDVRLKALEGDTPESKKGFKASEQGGIDIMKALLGDFAASQGLDVNALGIKANQTPKDDLSRITERLTTEWKNNGTAPVA